MSFVSCCVGGCRPHRKIFGYRVPRTMLSCGSNEEARDERKVGSILARPCIHQ